MAFLTVLGLHALVFALLDLTRGPTLAADELTPVVLSLNAPAIEAPPLDRARRSGGAPATAPRRARAEAPHPAFHLAPPEIVRPPASVPVLPRPAPDLVTVAGPSLSAPTSGAGASAAEGASGVGAGSGAGGLGNALMADPRWVRWPDVETVEAHYPAHAYDHHISGSATLRCLGGTDGRVRDCRVVSETPRREGFGRAALELSPHFLFAPLTVAQRPVEAWLTIPIDFSLTSGPEDN